ncbi:MAG TPA: LysE family transporter [Opitutaceae bacterium]|nr:LysE family transporter [Opitutaceae bacterium]
MISPLLLAKGVLIGFSIAAPVGPIGLLCIRRSLQDGWRAGLATGLGAATADCVYGCVAGLGLTVVSGFLVEHRAMLALLGGAFLCWLGFRTLRAHVTGRPAEAKGEAIGGAFFTTFLLTLTNPMTILAFVAVFSGLGLAGQIEGSGALIAGVFFGSAAWWLLLSSLVAVLRTRIGPTWLRVVNYGSGLLLCAFGIHSVITGLRG